MTATFFVLAHPFLESAFGAGTAIAVVSGLVGYLVVLRGQVFAGDALSHVAFTGALAALALGVDLRLGLYGGCVAFGLLLAVIGRRQGPDDTMIGSVFAWVLGLGALFLSLFTTSSTGVGGSGGTTGVSVLFGSILGLTGGQALADSVISVAVLAAVVTVARPLLFASLDPAVAGSRGVPVRSLVGRFLRTARSDRRGRHPSGRSPSPARSPGRPSRCRPPPHSPPVPGHVALGRHRRCLHVDRPHGGLPGAHRAPQLRDHRHGHRRLPGHLRLDGSNPQVGNPGPGLDPGAAGRWLTGGPWGGRSPPCPGVGHPPVHAVVCPS